jgi:hypothetical protein
MKARSDGFELSFTQPVNRELAANPANYLMESYTYRLEARYGGPEDDKLKVTIDSATVSEDGKKVVLRTKSLRAGYVHELQISSVKSMEGADLLHNDAYYTLVNIPD